MPKKIIPPNQSTLDNLPNIQQKTAIEIIKQQIEPMTITQVEPNVRADELILKISFKLPTRTAFSRVKADLQFDGQPMSSIIIKKLQGPLATDESEFSAVLDMEGIVAGSHTITLELYGLWDSNDKLCRTQKEISINYEPQTPKLRLVKVPSIKSVAGADIAVISDLERDVFLDMLEIAKKENQSKRDKW